MMLASCTMGGQCIGAPDTCLTPAPPSPSPIPIPYVNMAMVMMASNTATKVKYSNMPAVVEMSELPMSSGDEPGVNGGIMSGTFMGKCTFKLGSVTVKAEGKGVCYQTSMVGQNGASPNVPAGMQVVPSQFTVFISM
jgi:hypothetical protein